MYHVRMERPNRVQAKPQSDHCHILPLTALILHYGRQRKSAIYTNRYRGSDDEGNLIINRRRYLRYVVDDNCGKII